MKKRTIVLVAVLLCLTMLLASCDLFNRGKNNGAEIGDIINTDWVDSDSGDKVLSQGTPLNVNEGIVENSNSRYMVVRNSQGTSDVVYVYDISGGNARLLMTLNDSVVPGTNFDRITKSYVNLINNDHFAVLTVAYDYSQDIPDRFYSDSYYMVCVPFGYENGEVYVPSAYRLEQVSGNYQYQLTADYDLKIYNKSSGSPVDTIDGETLSMWEENCTNRYEYYFLDEYNTYVSKYSESSFELMDGLIVKDNAVYSVDEYGNEMLIKDFGVSKIPNSIYRVTEEYYIVRTIDDSNYYRTRYTFYDKQFNYVCTYQAPEYYDSANVFILNNGKILTQYQKALNYSKKDYDIISYHNSMTKYSLTMLIIDPKTGDETEIDANYVIESLTNTYTDSEEDNYCAEDLENIAMIRYIEDDKTIDNGPRALDWVSISNEGELLGSVKFSDDLVSYPVPLSDGYYMATSITGEIVILDRNGEEVNRINSGYDIKGGKCVVTDDAIYNILGEKVYDLKEKNVTETMWIGDSSFMAVYDLNGSTHYEFVVDGMISQSYTVNRNNLNDTSHIEGIYTALDDNAYCVCTAIGNNEYEYRYYNANGNSIGSFSRPLKLEEANEDFVIASTTNSDGKVFIYRYDFVNA